jgi:nitrite reductase/ring-hydroxylating ferredoxin subunit
VKGQNPPARPRQRRITRFRWYRALASALLPPRRLLKVCVGGHEILLARLPDGTAAACQPLCPHQQAQLVEGSIYMGALDCPLHHYLYDLRTGVNRYPRNVFPADRAAALAPLRLYPVCERRGAIWVQLRGLAGL